MAFNDLSPQTSDRLLHALTKLLKERTAISRITTYLMQLPYSLQVGCWRNSSCRERWSNGRRAMSFSGQVAEGTKAALLAALSRIPSSEDELLGGQV